MTDLRTAAQQALEALQWHYRQGHSNTLGGFRLKIDEKALRELSAALAQQEGPAQEPYTGDVTRIMRDAGMTFHLGLPHKAVVEQMTRVVDLVYAEASIKAAQQFAAALAQQAEGGGNLPPPLQAEPVAWECKAGGLKPLTQRQYDAQTAATKRHYTRIAPPQRKPLPLKTVEKLIYENTKISPNVADDRELLGYIVNAVRAVERAHGIKE